MPENNLFKKAAVFTDIHYGLKSNSIAHNTDCNNFVDWFIQKSTRRRMRDLFVPWRFSPQPLKHKHPNIELCYDCS